MNRTLPKTSTNIAPVRRSFFPKETHQNQPQCFRCYVGFKSGTSSWYLPNLQCQVRRHLWKVQAPRKKRLLPCGWTCSSFYLWNSNIQEKTRESKPSKSVLLVFCPIWQTAVVSIISKIWIYPTFCRGHQFHVWRSRGFSPWPFFVTFLGWLSDHFEW